MRAIYISCWEIARPIFHIFGEVKASLLRRNPCLFKHIHPVIFRRRLNADADGDTVVSTNGATDGDTDGTADGDTVVSTDGATDAATDGTADGDTVVSIDGATDGATDGTAVSWRDLKLGRKLVIRFFNMWINFW